MTSPAKPSVHVRIGKALRNGIKHSGGLEWAFADDDRLGAWLRQCLRRSRLDVSDVANPPAR